MIEAKRTPLYDLHVSLNAKMVPFGGYMMPVHYEAGILAEHRHTRMMAGLFDISHMGQILIEIADPLKGGDPLLEIEKIMPGDFTELAPGQMRYSFLLNEDGGIIDDLMVTRLSAPNSVFLIVNAGGKESDLNHIREYLTTVKATPLHERALLALQGPEAAKVLARYCDAPSKLTFMTAARFVIQDIGECLISRSGYTGEDGFEISVPGTTVEALAKKLLSEGEVKPIGLGARDSLRLEAGLCLYGHDLDEAITPVEANLTWAIGKRRRTEGSFMGGARIKEQLASGVSRKRVGFKPDSRAIARENTDIVDASGRKIGVVTSGGFGASVDGPIGMGYVETSFAKTGTPIFLMVRGTAQPAKVATLPFSPHRYVKG